MGKLDFKLDNKSTPSATRTVVFTPELKAAVKKTFNFENVEVYEEEEAKVKGALGHAIMMPFKFENNSYTKRLPGAANSYETTSYDDLLIPIAIIDASRAKNMEMTGVEGRDGTVKEYGSHGDYLVSIKGVFIGADGKYPQEEVNTLIDIEKAPVAVPIANDILLSYGITDLVVREVKWIPAQGVENAQAFELSCVSDTNVTLKLEGEV